MIVHDLVSATSDLTLGNWVFFGDQTGIDLIAATTNALNGALLARRPDHARSYTIVGILLMAVIGGIAGGVARDVILNDTPGAFINPAYITFCLIAGIIGYFLAYSRGQLFREGLFQFMTSVSLVWYAIVGAEKATGAGYPILGAMAIAVIAPTVGRWIIDVTSGVTPKQFVRSEWFVATAAGTGLVWILLDSTGLPSWASVLLTFLIGFAFRTIALYRGWEEPLAVEPAGVHIHADKRPHLGRKLAGKSVTEMKALGLYVEPAPADPAK